MEKEFKFSVVGLLAGLVLTIVGATLGTVWIAEKLLQLMVR